MLNETDLAWFGGTFVGDDATLATLAGHVAAIATLNAQHMHADEDHADGHMPPATTIEGGHTDALTVDVPILVPAPSDENDEHRARLSATLHSLYGFALSHFDSPMPDRPMVGAGGLMQPPSFTHTWDDLKGLAPECRLDDAAVKGRATGLDRRVPKTAWLTLPDVVDAPLRAVVDVAAAEFKAAHAPATVDRMFGARVSAVPIFVPASDAMVAAAKSATVPWSTAVTGEHRAEFLSGIVNKTSVMDAF